MKRILIVRLGSLGDLVHTLPAAAALRRAHPAADIDWLVDAVHRPFLDLVPVLSSVVALRDRTAGAWFEARRALKPRRYDVAIDFQGLIKSAALARFSGARRVLGFDRAALRERAAAYFYSQRVTVDDSQHVIRKNLQLARAAGATSDAIEFPIAAVESAVVPASSTPYAIVNPGAAWPNKRWPPDRLGAIAKTLRDRHGLASIVIWGPGEEAGARAVVAASDGAARIAPATGLHDLIALSRGARLMISGDTGPLHIAAAVGVPAVSLFGPTNARRNGPWAADDIAISRYEACDCHYERRCRRDPSTWCLGTITVEEVTDAIAQRMVRAQTSPGAPGRSGQ